MKHWCYLLGSVITFAAVGWPVAATAGTPAPTAGLEAPASGAGKMGTVLSQPGQEAFFSRVGAGGGTFALAGGTYDLDLLAEYSASDDPDGAGRCQFSGYVQGGRPPVHLSLSADAPIQQTTPYNTSPVLVLGAGQYALTVSVFTTCWWKFVVLDLGKPVFSKAGHHLLPTALHEGMCPQQAFPDGSEQAQVDLYGMSCRYATGTLGAQADHHGGASFRTTYFECTSRAEGRSSAWAASWHGTYFRYDCTGKDAEAAFNWGRDYAL